MIRELHSNKGFSLLELMIVLAIIGVLAAAAIPRFMKVAIKSKQSEAELILKQIFVMERAYREENDGYWIPAGAASAATSNAFTTIGIELMPSARYTYTIVGTANSFTAVATCGILDDDPKVDTWIIDNLGQLTVASDDATG